MYVCEQCQLSFEQHFANGWLSRAKTHVMNGHKNFFGNKYPSVQALSRRVPVKKDKKKRIYRERIHPFCLGRARCMDKAGSIIPLSLFPFARTIRN